MNHKKQVWGIQNTATTKRQHTEMEAKHGVQLSSLIHLLGVVIDPMHNLLPKNWKEFNLLDEKDFTVLQHRFHKMKVSSSIGRIPSKIASSFKDFPADQFKNWALVFSIFPFKGILPERHLQYWKLFARVCHILCSPVITTSLMKVSRKTIFSTCFLVCGNCLVKSLIRAVFFLFST